MCMGCMTNADVVLTSGILGAAGVRVGARQLLSRPPRWTRMVTDEEAREFVASLAPPPVPAPTGMAPPPAVAAVEVPVRLVAPDDGARVLAGR